jgi:ArsR family transcriptional regulator
MNTEDILGEMAGFFKALGDPNRLKIIYFLATDASGTLGVGDLARLLGISQPAVTQHLKILKGVQIVEARKEGYRMYFTFNRERLLHYQGQSAFLNDCIMGKCDQEEGYAGQNGEPALGNHPEDASPVTGARRP